MPFVTEEVWSWWQPGSVHRAPWPTLDELPAGGDPTLLDDVAEVLIAIRGAKSRAQVKMRTEVDRAVISGPAESLARLETIARDTERDNFKSAEASRDYGLVDHVLERRPEESIQPA